MIFDEDGIANEWRVMDQSMDRASVGNDSIDNVLMGRNCSEIIKCILHHLIVHK